MRVCAFVYACACVYLCSVCARTLRNWFGSLCVILMRLKVFIMPFARAYLIMLLQYRIMIHVNPAVNTHTHPHTAYGERQVPN